jgi:hypothetical protein
VSDKSKTKRKGIHIYYIAQALLWCAYEPYHKLCCEFLLGQLSVVIGIELEKKQQNNRKKNV